ncbi:MAG: hypothetical protein ACRD2Q_09355 [Terriglobales bacterium]
MNKLLALLLCLSMLTIALPAQETPAEVTETPALRLPAGTAVRLKLETPISTSVSKPGDAFYGRVTQSVVYESKTVIPVGASVEGTVTRVSESRRIKGRPTIELRPNLLVMPDGTRYHINAVVVDTDPATKTQVSEEGQIKGEGMSKRDKVEIGVGTGAGLTVGALAGGGKGAFVGAVIGAGATVTHWLTKRKSAELPAGTEIVMELDRPVEMAAETAGK